MPFEARRCRHHPERLHEIPVRGLVAVSARQQRPRAQQRFHQNGCGQPAIKQALTRAFNDAFKALPAVEDIRSTAVLAAYVLLSCWDPVAPAAATDVSVGVRLRCAQ